MNFRTLFTPAALAGLLALPGAASALDAIPAFCLKCRQAPDDTAFITCLYECLADLKTAPGASSGDASKSKAGTPSADSGKSGKKTQADGLPAFEGGWTVYDRPDAAEGDQARSAELLSRSAVSAFFQRVQPVLVLAKEKKGDVHAFLNLEPAVVGSFSDRVLVQFDEGRPRALPLRALMGGSAVLLQDKTFLKDLASARKLYVRLDLFGAPAQTMAFDLGDVKGVMKWLDEADAVRS